MSGRWTVLLAGMAVAVTLLIFAPVSERPAHAGALDDVFEAWFNQDGQLMPPSKWERFPDNWKPYNGELTDEDYLGQIEGI